MQSGCLQVYTGDGKGKTTAALGLALRAVGAGLRVFIGQLRQKLEADPAQPRHLLTETAVGYRLLREP